MTDSTNAATSDPLRQEFEEWGYVRDFDIARSANRDCEQRYASERTQGAWSAFQHCAANFRRAPTDSQAGRDARVIAAEQAEDDGLWFVAQTAPEAYLQQALRRLHEAVESTGQAGRDAVEAMQGVVNALNNLPAPWFPLPGTLRAAGDACVAALSTTTGRAAE